MGFAQDRPQHVRLMTPTGSGGGFSFLAVRHGRLPDEQT